MKTVISFLLLVVCFCSHAFATQVKKKSAKEQKYEQELIQLESDLANAFVKGDKVFYEKVLTEDHTSIDFLGKIYTKKDVLADLRPSTAEEYATIKLEQIEVRLYKDMAIVTGKAVVTYTSGERVFVNPTRFTDTFVRRNGRWLQAASHSTRIATPPPK